MRAQFINEGSNKFIDEEIEQMASEIASIVYMTYNGDDVDYDPNEEDTAEVEQIIKDNVDISKLRYVDEAANIDEPLTEDGLDVFGDEEWIINQVPEEDIKNLSNAFKNSKYSNDMGEDVTDDLEDDDDDLDESLNESDKSDDYTEAHWKMDKFMPDDPFLQTEFYEIIDDEEHSKEEKIEELINFFNEYADEEIMHRYFPKNGTIEGFATYIIENE